ncbi:hypothetical protein K461DRAFT_65711 [Myriangium duriaei CBS 260.36]|uniref:2EXR domain-containing protein n=1 Tax=Myriangium duriaei CBS 260.36 TaxID=1168546 RepID=A0A9P4IU51_9PEZI|nr:hypothetical protein K461DRAFT_65711 [Myriangium duriaei CBS 260.36]
MTDLGQTPTFHLFSLLPSQLRVQIWDLAMNEILDSSHIDISSGGKLASSPAPSMSIPAPTPTFHLFPILPTELRMMIWELTVPGTGPSVCPYDPTTFDSPRRYPRSGPHAPEETTLCEMYISYPLSAIESVCHEARDTILPLAISRAVVQRGLDGGVHLIVRPLDPDKCVLYFREPLRWVHEVRRQDPFYESMAVALPMESLSVHRDLVVELLEETGVVYVECDSPIRPLKLDGCREIDLDKGWALKFDPERKAFVHTAGGYGEIQAELAADINYVAGKCIRRGVKDAEIRQLVLVR